MLSFVNDYCEGAHPLILQKLTEINLEKQTGYGLDKYCKSAEEKIRNACGCPNADVRFLTGGTQTNLIAIDTMTEPYEGVIAAETGHVAVHEAGAIEYTGHKVLSLPSHDGKILASELKAYLARFFADDNFEHMVIPGIVYISLPTELGTLYSKGELADIHDVCTEYGIPLYVDGARLGTALAADPCLSLADIAANCEAFYIGGTKCGALFGEALVFTKGNLPRRFVTRIKQHGALLAKGWVVGIQYDVLFTDGLYEKLGRNAMDTAAVIKKALEDKGYKFYIDSPTNQIFVVMENTAMKALAEKVNFSFWENLDENHTVIRFVTSWATSMDDAKALAELL